MCEECGCEKIDVNKVVTEFNDMLAHNTYHYLQDLGIICINIMGAPGSGKTTLIEGLAEHMGGIAVIQGDLESDLDKKRLEKAGIDTYQINTHSGCHLNAYMVIHAISKLNLEGKRYLLIENVGNLVCPAGVKLGQHKNLVVSSTTEGSDKPRKYPHIFRDADLVVLSKMDLADAVDFSLFRYVDDIKRIKPDVKIVRTSKVRGFADAALFIEEFQNQT